MKIKLTILSFGLLLSLMSVVVLPIGANPSTQYGADFATPTLNAVDTIDFDIVSVGGSSVTVTYPAERIGAFQIGETHARSDYPNGATFLLTIEAVEPITNVTLIVRYPHNSGTRAIAQPTAVANEWQALLYEQPGQPPWQEFDFFWRITDAQEVTVESTPQHFVYSDPTRVWFKAETPLLKLYWFGADAEIATVAMQGMYAIHERHVQGFGKPLSYTPIAVLFPDLTSFAEFAGGGTSGASRRAGFTSNQLGMTVQRLGTLGVTFSCPAYPPATEQTLQWLYESTATTITHEVAHLYQFENNINGPTWFIEGGATWFSTNPTRGRQEGLRDRPADADLPTLQGYGPSTSGFTPNGCNALAYWMGTSFINYIYGSYGMDAIGTWLDLIGSNVVMDDALIQVTGKDLAALEADWRAYLGITAEVFVLPTPAYQFRASPTPFGQ